MSARSRRIRALKKRKSLIRDFPYCYQALAYRLNSEGKVTHSPWARTTILSGAIDRPSARILINRDVDDPGLAPDPILCLPRSAL